MNSLAQTHRLAVNAYLVHEDKFLLLKRNTEPRVWGPPGGRLLFEEDPVKGLIREIEEETGIQARVICPVTTWFGHLHGGMLLSVDYLCIGNTSEVILSAEHSEFAWASIDQLKKERQKYFSYEKGFTLENFEYAYRILNLQNLKLL